MKLAALRVRWTHRLATPWSRTLARVDPRVVYIGLAVVLVGWMMVLTGLDRQHHVKTSTYDWMLTHRLLLPPPDRDIVLVDIDERSLAAMASEYGRWPWPRDVLATVLEELQAQGAKAVVFDILFSDPDRQNPVSERAFEAAVVRNPIAYFPVLRLNPANDAKSAVHASQLTGLVVPRVASPSTDPTLAVVLPYFDGILRTGHLGTNNVDPDGDSIIRRYRVWEDVGDHRVLSLPARMAIDFGWTLPDASPKRIRFNDKVLAYRTVSFSDVFADFLRRDRTRPRDEFRGRIVVIGATAPGLYDSKGTPVSRTHPGVDVLATAIDNAKNDAFFHELPPAVDIAVAIVLLIVMPYLCIRYSHEQLRLAFVIAPSVLFGISYLSMNVSKTFVDLTAPASMAFLYFSAVKLYSGQLRKRWAGDDWFAPRFQPGVRQWIGCLASTLRTRDRIAGFETKYINVLRTVAPHARITSGLGSQSGWLGSAFNGVLVATWVERADDDGAADRDRGEANELAVALQTLSKSGTPLHSHFEQDVLEPDAEAMPALRASGEPEAVAPGQRALRTVRGLVTRTMLQSQEVSS